MHNWFSVLDGNDRLAVCWSSVDSSGKAATCCCSTQDAFPRENAAPLAGMCTTCQWPCQGCPLSLCPCCIQDLRDLKLVCIDWYEEMSLGLGYAQGSFWWAELVVAFGRSKSSGAILSWHRPTLSEVSLQHSDTRSTLSSSFCWAFCTFNFVARTKLGRMRRNFPPNHSCFTQNRTWRVVQGIEVWLKWLPLKVHLNDYRIDSCQWCRLCLSRFKISTWCQWIWLFFVYFDTKINFTIYSSCYWCIIRCENTKIEGGWFKMIIAKNMYVIC